MLFEVSYCVKVKIGNCKGVGIDVKVVLMIIGKFFKSMMYKMVVICFYLFCKYKCNYV